MGRQPTGTTSFPSFSLLSGNPGHAGAAVPAYPDRPNSHPNTPHPLPQAVHSSNSHGMTFPGHHRAGLPGDAGVSRGWPPVGRGPGTGQVPIHIPTGGNQMRPYRFQPYRRAAVLPLHSDRRVTCLENLPS